MFKYIKIFIIVYVFFLTLCISVKAGNPVDPIEIIESSVDVPWLEKIAGSLEGSLQEAALRPNIGISHRAELRTAAYARLGALGTQESLAAVERIENTAKKNKSFASTPTIQMGWWSHPAWAWGEIKIEPLVQIKAKDGKVYGIIHSTFLGETDFFLTSSNDPNENIWTRPKLIATAPASQYLKEPELIQAEDDILNLSFTRDIPTMVTEQKKIEISISQVTKDSDSDGWTDLEELRLCIDPNNPDTDGDGIKDGDDITPNYAPSPDDNGSDEVAVIQKAIFAVYGLSESRHLLLVKANFRKVQVWGYSGPIIYQNDSDNRDKLLNLSKSVFVEWTIETPGGRGATRPGMTVVKFTDRMGGGGDMQYIYLQRKLEKWYVIARVFGPVS